MGQRNSSYNRVCVHTYADSFDRDRSIFMDPMVGKFEWRTIKNKDFINVVVSVAHG
jgi:hypothetical protein